MPDGGVTRLGQFALPLANYAAFLAKLSRGGECVGPFSNHPNLDTDYGAVGNSTGPGNGADDTVAVQAALDDLGNTGVHNIWGPTGGYRITDELNLSDRQFVTLLMEDPANTKFIWDGPEGGTMFNVNGVAYSRLFHRCKMQANGATTAIDQARLGPSTGNFDTGNSYEDITFEDFEICIDGGALGYGFAETSMRRLHFVRATKVAVLLRNFNALNCWLRYCTFDDCENDVANGIPALSLVGAGGWRAYRCISRNCVGDNFTATSSSAFGFSARECYSIGANRFWHTNFTAAAGHVTLQKNTVLDTKDDWSIYMGGPGPYKVNDNNIRARVGNPGVSTVVGSGVTNCDCTAINNKSTAAVIQNHGEAGSRLLGYGNTVVDRSTISDAVPFDIEPTPPRSSRTVFEVASGGNVAAAVASAVAVDGLVHLQEGTYAAPVVPADSDIEIVGDGYMTHITGLTDLNGPLKFTGYDFRADGNFLTDAIRARNIDQPGARFYMEGCQLRGGVLANFRYGRLDHLLVEAEDIGYLGLTPIGLQIIGGPLANAGTPAEGRVNIYSGLCANISNYGHDVSEGGKLLVRDTWLEESITEMLAALRTTGGATVTYEASKSYQVSGDFAQINDLVGKVSLLNIVASGDTVISGDSSGGKVLADGFIMMSDYLPAHDYFDNAGGAEAFLQNSREWDLTPDIPGSDTSPTPNEGTVTEAFMLEMFAQTRAELPAPITDLADGVTDIRLFRVWPINGTYSINLVGDPIMAAVTRLGQFGVPLSAYGTFAPKAPAGADVPDAPTIGTAVGGNASATVAFTPPVDDGGSAITGYTATSTPGSHTGSGAGSPVTVAGLTNDTPYTFTVHATNIIGNSAESAASNSVTPSAPASAPDSGTQVKGNLRWAAGLRRAEPDDTEEENQDAENAAAALLLVS